MGNNNLDFCNKKVKAEVQAILDNPEVSFMTKHIIKEGLNKDCVDVVSYVQLAVNTLRTVRDNIL